MEKTAKTVCTFILIFFAMILIGAAVLMRGTFAYVKSCAHISVRTNVEAQVGDTLTIDQLAYISNDDERRITGIIGGTGEISEDGQSITITDGEGPVEIYVFATNDHAPERTEKAVKVIVKKAEKEVDDDEE